MSELQSIVLHRTGNKALDEPLAISAGETTVNEELKELLSTYFLSSFRENEYFHLHHGSDLSLNEVYAYASKVFEDPANLYEQSVNLARHLYEKSTHPKIKGGEFYTAYFTGCHIDGESVDAIGLFKSENKDTFLKIYSADNNFRIESDEGININKLDKGCLIYNSNAAGGYVLAVADHTNRGNDARYWVDEFLQVRQRKDNYSNTENALSLCKTFVTRELPRQFEITKADQADMMNKAVKFFKENETFDQPRFENEVMGQPELIDSFNQYKTEYQKEREITIDASFDISGSAVKKQMRGLRSVIKLDKNFHIYVHGDRHRIQRGYDETTGMHYYQLFFEQET